MVNQDRTYQFIAGAACVNSLPKCCGPEVALVGRSNVGKSSLLNALVGARKMARVSSNPGCTRQINFYEAYSGGLRLVDLPGYGYSRASKVQIADYLDLVQYYLSDRISLRAVILLIDSRRGFMEIDMDFVHWLNQVPLSCGIAITKCDKLTKDEFDEITRQIIYDFSVYCVLREAVIATSTRTGLGIKELQYEITRIAFRK